MLQHGPAAHTDRHVSRHTHKHTHMSRDKTGALMQPDHTHDAFDSPSDCVCRQSLTTPGVAPFQRPLTPSALTTAAMTWLLLW